MKRSTDRILTTHAGALEQPAELREILRGGGPKDTAFANTLRASVAEVVRRQSECGLDVINDGEYGKQNFYRYVAGRISGFEMKHIPDDRPPWNSIRRDANDFLEYYDQRGKTLFGRGAGVALDELTCTGPLKYTGQAELTAELDNFKSALQAIRCEEAFLPAPGPTTLLHTTTNQHYASEQDYLFALADALQAEYAAIVKAGFILQIDEPHLAMAWQTRADMTLSDYRAAVELWVAAINRAMQGIASDRVRLHTCWGSWVGPHSGDVPLANIVDLLFQVNAQGLSIEASNPRHEHEWQVFEAAKLPEGKVLIPGVLCHISDFVEHPELVAQRLIRYAKLVGRENVIAGTDCGLRRVGHPDIAWAKFQAMVEGARLASKALWT